MQSAVTQAKFQKNSEIDLVFRLALLKFLTLEIGNQFANLILEGKEWVSPAWANILSAARSSCNQSQAVGIAVFAPPSRFAWSVSKSRKWWRTPKKTSYARRAGPVRRRFRAALRITEKSADFSRWRYG